MSARWTVVACWQGVGPLDGAPIPASVGRHFRRTRIGARLLAARQNRAETARDCRYLPPVRWHAERATTPDRRSTR